MCGIFGYSGSKSNAGEIVAQGLKRLDYRGYDSWGIAVQSDQKLEVRKKAGKISDVISFTDLPKSSTAIAHTRWATTGAVNDINAHPHYSTDKYFSLAQNGIVENYQELKEKLIKKGYKFISTNDTEVITRLIEDKFKSTKSLKEAVYQAFAELEGRNTIILLTTDGQILAARNGSPLVVGINPETKEIFLSSLSKVRTTASTSSPIFTKSPADLK
jgi:glucosamine--fructose-6-phosphate aminotransferase (isomerizing)